jgi:hypothetical protein
MHERRHPRPLGPTIRRRPGRAHARLARRFGVALVALAASVGAAAPDGWREARSPDGYFRIEMPGAFQPFAEDTETKDGIKGRTTGVRANVGAAFGATNAYVASCLVPLGDERTPEERVRAGMEYWQKLKPLHYHKPVKLGDVPGVEFQLSDDVKVIRSRVYAPGDRTCTLLMHWRPFAKPPDAEIDRFFDSFRLTSR